MTTEKSYEQMAHDDAVEMIEYYIDEIVEFLDQNSEAPDDLFNQYPRGDEYHHESHVDKSYTLLEAAQLLDELSKFEETDSGLWEGLEPRQAISAQAAYTYGNAVLDNWSEYIQEINESYVDVEEGLLLDKNLLEAKADQLAKLCQEFDSAPVGLQGPKQAVLDNLLAEADTLTPEAIQKSYRESIKKFILVNILEKV